jgi:CHAT domain-containing protein
LENARQDASAAARSVDFSERAIRLDPTRGEAWFNRALALEYLGLTAAANSAWQEYLTRDSESGWATEARQHQARMHTVATDWAHFKERLIAGADLADAVIHDMVSRAADRCRELLQDDLLQRWADTVLVDPRGGSRGGNTPSHWLRSARRLASSLHAVRGDRTFLDEIQHIEMNGRTPVAVERLARATLAGIRARAAIDRGNAEAAIHDLATARRAFAGPSGTADVIDFYALMADYYRADYASVVTALQKLARGARSRNHTYVEARCTFLLAAIAVRQARVSDALELYRTATELFTRVGETGYVASAKAIVSVRYREQGDHAAAWNLQREALALLDRIETPRHVTTVLRTAQTGAVEQHLAGLAVHFTSALVDLSERSGNINTLIQALADQSRQQALTRDDQSARRSLQRARIALSKATDPNMGAILGSIVARAEAVLLTQSAPCEAAALLTAAIGTVKRVVPNQIAATFLERGRALRACGRIDEALADFRSGIRTLEDQQRGQREASLRISRLDQVWDLYGELIRVLALDRNQPDEALLAAEQSRARELALVVGGRTINTFTTGVEDFQASIPERATAVSYVVLPRELLVWSVTRSTRRFIRVDVGADELAGLIAQWRTAVIDGQDERALGKRLFEILVKPILSTFVPEGYVIVVADGPLHELPMAGLWDGERYLVERTAVWSAPSLRLFEWASTRLRESQPVKSRLLAVGDPAFSAARFPRLPRLREADREATTVARFYPATTLLLGAEATKPRILEAMRQSDVVHLAAHAIADLAAPPRSFIVTAASSSSSDDTITAADIERQLRHLPTRLLALSACQTAAGRVARGEGMISLARAFMAAGVPIILANLWEATDRASYPLFVDLHRSLASGHSAVDALRGAQIRLLHSADEEERRVRTWAGVVGLGATGPISRQSIQSRDRPSATNQVLSSLSDRWQHPGWPARRRP